MAKFAFAIKADERTGRRHPVDRLSEVKSLIKTIYILVFLPVACIFIYSLLTDPAVPYIIKTLWKKKMNITTSYLGKERQSHS